jgi:hypothetical protein
MVLHLDLWVTTALLIKVSYQNYPFKQISKVKIWGLSTMMAAARSTMVPNMAFQYVCSDIHFLCKVSGIFPN